MRFCTELTARAESDLQSDARQGETIGVFQQNPKWWPSATQGTEAQCRAFVADFKANEKAGNHSPVDRRDPVRDCWVTQRWAVPNEGKTWPDPGPEFEAEKTRERSETWNYARRVADLTELIGIRPAEPRVMAVGGATTSRGVVWLADLPGSTPAEKLRTAWTPGTQDRRTIIADHNAVIDVGASPIPVPAGVCLASPAGPQTEFSDQGRVFLKGVTSAFRSVDKGTNYTGTKGWSMVNIGFEGQPGLRFMAPNPMDASGPVIAYASIEGCSFDLFRTIIESPMLGVTMDVRYFNNITGECGWKLTGSDCQLWTHGGKGDWGGGQTDPKRRALVWFAGLEKSTVGAAGAYRWPTSGGGLYLTCSGAAGIEVEGSPGRGGLDLFGVTVEGRNASAPAAGAAVRMTGAVVNWFGGNVNYAMGNSAASGRGDRGSVDVSGGSLAMFGTQFRRGASTAPHIARRGSGMVDTFGCREVPGLAPVTATNV